MWLYHRLQKVNFVKNFVDDYMDVRSKRMLSEIELFLSKKDRILDIGSGTGHMAWKLRGEGYKKVSCVDCVDMSIFPKTKPLIYDGKKLPFKKNSFEVAMLLTVLHHTSNPELIISEASRVAKRLVIMEDTYNNDWQRYATYAMDSIGNMEFVGHPHTNKTDAEWLKLFKKLNLKLVGKKVSKFLWFFESTTYCVEKK